MQTTTKPNRSVWWIYFLLVAVTALAYWRSLQNEFVIYDDPDYVTSNAVVQAGLTWKGIAWAFTTLHASNWHPLTWLSHMLDCQLYGLRPAGHHLTSLLLHIANTLLLFHLLRRTTAALWRSAFVAMLFALHPMHVESVAWVAERKDVLSATFFLLTLLAYCRHAEGGRQKAEGRGRRWAWYGLALLLFALGLMSKPMLVTLPFVLLLLDYWPLQRVSGARCQVSGGASSESLLPSLGRLIAEKLPFFILAALSCWITVVAQSHGNAVMSEELYPLGKRLINLPAAYAWYLFKLIAPVKLAILYPLQTSRPLWQGFGAASLVIALTLLAVKQARRQPHVFVGWFWFAGMLVPVCGLVQVGHQAYADRYTYLPHVGLFIVLAWGLERLATRWPHMRIAWPTIAGAALVTCLGMTWRQVHFWENSETVFRRALAVTSNNTVAHNSLGLFLSQQGRLEEAYQQFSTVLQIDTNDLHATVNQAAVLADLGKVTPGKAAEAVARYRQVLTVDTNFLPALNNLAWLLATHPDSGVRDGAEAVRVAERACQLTKYEQPMPLGTLAAAYAEAGRFADAIATAQKARDLARAAGMKELADRNDELLASYRAGKAFHQDAQQRP